MKKIKYIFVLFILSLLTSCEAWLDLGSEDRIMENNLFENQSGFMTALNGVYIDMLNSSLYGGTLSFKTFDIMAQYYDCLKDEQAYQALAEYNDQAKKSQVSHTWSKCYYLIHNINTILEHCDSDRKVLSDDYYHVIQGECYALRALLHFELFRIFGPIYAKDPERSSIPYMNSTEMLVQPLLKANEVAQLIFQDLEQALTLLADYDPIIKEGTLFSPAEEGLLNDMRYRNIRLNYYATKALMARVALYVNNKDKALEYATQVVKETQEDNKWFPFATRQEMEGSGDISPDRIYSSEILFGAYHAKRKTTIYESFFSNKLLNNSVLKPLDKAIDKLYNEDENDIRYLQWETLTDPEDNEGSYFVKYMDANDNNTGHRFLIPIIRISEMYLIIAECHSDPSEALKALNKVRNARRVISLTDITDIQPFVEIEFKREMIGEGQLFWMYKRLNKEEIPSGSDLEQKIKMEEAFYLFSIPDEEANNRK